MTDNLFHKTWFDRILDWLWLESFFGRWFEALAFWDSEPLLVRDYFYPTVPLIMAAGIWVIWRIIA